MNWDEYITWGAKAIAPKGENAPQAKLTAAQVAQIRRAHLRKQRLIRRLNDRYSAKALAARYGVHVRTIEKALRGETYQEMPP